MLVAVIAAVATVVVALAVIVAVFAVVRGRRSDNVSVKRDVRSISSVGVSSSLPDADRRVAGSASSPTSPQRSASGPAGDLKSRFVAMGVLAAGVFGSLAVKLWSMQVLEQSSYARASDENQYATVYEPAPRGFILDADGLALVKNRTSLTVLAEADVADDRDVIMRLSALLGVPAGVVRNRVRDATAGAQSKRVVASDVRMRDAAFIMEHSDAFPNVTVQERSVREYPYGALAAHVLGYTGAVTSDDLEKVAEGRDLESGDEVGRAGVEAAYDDLLAGDHGESKVVADTNGNVVEVVSQTQPVKGSDVYLTIKGPVQYACDRALAELIAPDNGTVGSGTGTAGAAVVMDVTDGGIVAMASFPTYAPETFVGGVTQDVWDVYQADDAHTPMLNRAIQGTYPAASTYKAFTGLAALAYGFADTKRTWACGGSWDGWGSGDVQKCWNHAGHGTLDFRGGIVNSCDVVFYDIAYNFFQNREAVGETAMQDYIKKYRFGEATGIDLAGEDVGRVPTPAWKAEYFRDTPEEAAWKGGDSTNMVIGQGYVLTTPLQVAVAYGAIATGKIMRPHVLKEVRNVAGDVALTFPTEVVAEPDVPMSDLAVVRDALKGVSVENAEIAAVFAENGIDPATVACKTGTAEVAGKDDFAWFACYAPYDNPKYVVACVVEEGGGGSAVGAPLGARLLAAALDYDAGELADMGVVAGYAGRSVEYVGSSSGRTD